MAKVNSYFYQILLLKLLKPNETKMAYSQTPDWLRKHLKGDWISNLVFPFL